jgi:hypothetical protein
MTWLRRSWVAIPSNPNPSISELGVVIEAPTGNPDASARVESFAFGALPAGGLPPASILQ